MMFRLRFIVFIFFIAMLSLGCGIFYKGGNMLVRKLDAIILTRVDLPTMEEDAVIAGRRGGVVEQPPVVDGYQQSWNGTQPEEHIYVNYWLFQTVADAQKAADQWRYFISSQGDFQPEPTAAAVIGDATWRRPNRGSIWFVKNNVLVYIMARRPKVNQLALTRSVARKVEAKINGVLNPL